MSKLAEFKAAYLKAIKDGTDHDILRVSGEALYGERWQSALACDLGVSDRTMRRWLAGENAIPQGVYGDLLSVLKDRASYINTYIKALEEAGIEG